MSAFGWYRPWLSDLQASSLSGKAKGVGAVLAVEERNGVVEKSAPYIAERASQGLSTARRALGELEADGWVSVRQGRYCIVVTLIPRSVTTTALDGQEVHHDVPEEVHGDLPGSEEGHGDYPGSSPQPTPTTELPEQLEGELSLSDDVFDAEPLLELFIDLLRRNDSNAAVGGLRLRPLWELVARDGRAPDEVERVMRWALADSFWKSRIVTPGKLRQHFTQLAIRAREDGPVPGGAPAVLLDKHNPSPPQEATKAIERAIAAILERHPESEVFLHELHVHRVEAGTIVCGAPAGTVGWMFRRRACARGRAPGRGRRVRWRASPAGGGVMTEARIPIRSRGMIVGHALVDIEDFDRLARYGWRVGCNGYATDVGRTTTSMHREVLRLAPGQSIVDTGHRGARIRLEIDHRNGRRLDNRRSNLRLTSRQWNMWAWAVGFNWEAAALSFTTTPPRPRQPPFQPFSAATNPDLTLSPSRTRPGRRSGSPRGPRSRSVRPAPLAPTAAPLTTTDHVPHDTTTKTPGATT